MFKCQSLKELHFPNRTHCILYHKSTQTCCCQRANSHVLCKKYTDKCRFADHKLEFHMTKSTDYEELHRPICGHLCQ